jgi:hypothetical protein
LRQALLLRDRKARCGAVEPDEALCDEYINECPAMFARFLGHVVSIMTDPLEKSIEGMIAVNELPAGAAGKILLPVGAW